MKYFLQWLLNDSANKFIHLLSKNVNAILLVLFGFQENFQTKIALQTWRRIKDFYSKELNHSFFFLFPDHSGNLWCSFSWYKSLPFNKMDILRHIFVSSQTYPNPSQFLNPSLSSLANVSTQDYEILSFWNIARTKMYHQRRQIQWESFITGTKFKVAAILFLGFKWGLVIVVNELVYRFSTTADLSFVKTAFSLAPA